MSTTIAPSSITAVSMPTAPVVVAPAAVTASAAAPVASGPVASTRVTMTEVTLRRPLGPDVELPKYEAQLSDWVHGASASTPEGQAKIEEISAKIYEIKEAMQKAQAAADSWPKALGNLLDIHA